MPDCLETAPEFGRLPVSMAEVLAWRAESEPDRIAYTFLSDGEREEHSITYGELYKKALSIAVMIQGKVSRGDRLVLIYPPGIEFLEAFFGCLLAGVIAVPVYPPRKDRDLMRILAILNNSDSSAVLTTSPVLSRLEKVRSQFSVPELERLHWLVSDGDEVLNGSQSSWTDPGIKGEDIAFLQYTSGSTGLPKGVMISHGNLIYNQRMLTPSTAHSRDCVLVTWLPLYHDMGLIGNIMHPLYIGFRCIFMSPEAFLQKPFRWLSAISRYKATTTGGAPNFAFDLCVSRITQEQKEELDLSSWTFALVGSDTVRHATLDRFCEAFSAAGFRRETFYPAYGLAEATLIVSGGFKDAAPIYLSVDSEALKDHRVVAVPAGHANSQILVGCGQTWLDQKIKIVNPDRFTECRPDQVGEIWVAGENVSSGYWNNEEATQTLLQAALADGDKSERYLRTGDLGFLKEGELYITGRIKNLIVIRGRNHYPQDIEATVESSVEALRAGCSAAFTVDVDGEERLVVIAELERRFMSDRRQTSQKIPLDNRSKSDRREFNEEDTGIAELEQRPILDEAIQRVRQVVAEEHGLQTHAIVLIRPVSIPKTTSGKLRRLDCRKQFLNDELVVIRQWSEPGQPPADPVEPGASVPVSKEAVQSWLLSQLSVELNMARHQIDPHVELFRYGLDSLKAVSMTGALQEWLGHPVSPTLFYNFPTIEALADHLSSPDRSSEPGQQIQVSTDPGDSSIAIIGAACRFPGADSLEAFWQLLMNGKDAITEVPADRWDSQSCFSPQQGIPGKMNTHWGGFLKGVDLFDPLFFGISPREAAKMDPQQRILLEVSWHALENAGLNIKRLGGSQTGVFIGISSSEYSRLSLASQQDLDVYNGTGGALSIASNRLSYHYDFRGPSISIDTACSSSLVSVHMACQSLQNGESTLALAGGVNLILTPETTVVFSQAGMMAADGRCKTFDAAADGYVRSEGCGLVVLKRLPDAIKAGDNILAVIRGSAVNQDGRSNGITAPSGLAQQSVISQALAKANVKASQIGYVEAHGTGTSLGDPIEVEALKSVMMKERSDQQSCLLGSVKTNLGHLESAAGIAGLLKAMLAVKHRKIPPHLHLTQINPLIQLENFPLSIPTELQDWPSQQDKPLAGVSSFGFGGTNSHLILEAFEQQKIPFVDKLPFFLFTLSAKTGQALQKRAADVLKILDTVTDRESLAHLCFTSNRAHSHLNRRWGVVVESVEALADALESLVQDKEEEQSTLSDDLDTHLPLRISYHFPDLEAFTFNEGRLLYQSFPGFRRWIDRCDTYLQSGSDLSIESMMTGRYADLGSPPELLAATVFAIEYALARTWSTWGVAPDLLTGDGVGKLVAACLADVYSLESGIKLAAQWGRLKTASSSDRVQRLETTLKDLPLANPSMPLWSEASHSLVTHLPDLRNFILSSLDTNDSPSPPVDSSAENRIRLLLGPSPENGTSVDQKAISLASLPGGENDWLGLLSALRQIYLLGIDIDWDGLYKDFPYMQLVSFPNTPFQKKRYWIASSPVEQKAAGASPLYQVQWIPSDRDPIETPPDSESIQAGFWLIFTDKEGIGDLIAEEFRQRGGRAVRVASGDAFSQESDLSFVLNPRLPEHYERLLSELGLTHGTCLGVVYLWSLMEIPCKALNESILQQSLQKGSFSLIQLVQAMSRQNRPPQQGMILVTRQAHAIQADNTTEIAIEQSPLWGLGKSIALEFPDITCQLIDLERETVENSAKLIIRELFAPMQEWQLALRAKRRYVARLRPLKQNIQATDTLFGNNDATYVVTGGLGHLGLMLAEWLAEKGAGTIALIGRHASRDGITADPVRYKTVLERLDRIEQTGASLHLFKADVSQRHQVDHLFQSLQHSMPPIRGIFHAAGMVSKNTLSGLSKDQWDDVMAAKVMGTWLLHEYTRTLDLEYFVLFSSISSIWGSREIAHYAAANAFLDGFAHFRHSLGLKALTINWGPWKEGGMTSPEEQARMNRIGISALETQNALSAMESLLAGSSNQAIVASVDWSRLNRLYGSMGYQSLFEELVLEDSASPHPDIQHAQAPEAKGEWLEELSALSPVEQKRRLADLLLGEISQALHCQPSDIDEETGFFDLGIDSLIAVELKEKLESGLSLSLSSTLIFDYPNMKALTSILLEQLGTVAAPEHRSTAERVETTFSPPPPDPSELDQLSAEELADLIDKELEDL